MLMIASKVIHIGGKVVEDSSETAASIVSAFASRVGTDGGVTESLTCMEERVQNLMTLGLWDQASAVWLPHGYKEGKLYAAKGGATADFSFTRNGTRTRKGPTYVEQVPYNLLKDSEVINGGAWTVTGVTVSANATTAPDGTITADGITETTSSGGHQLLQTVTGKSAVSIQYTYTAYLKPNGRDWVALQLTDASNGFAKCFNVNTGAIGATRTLGTGATLDDFSITLDNNGFYKCRIVVTSSASATLRADILILSADGVYTYTGDITKGIFVWGTQLIEGATERDYIPTTDRFNVPALDYTNDTCPALSLEPARTNLYIHSEDFSNVAWVKNNCTVTTNVTIAPDGYNTADALVEDSSTNYHRIARVLAIPDDNTVSFFLKAGGRTKAYIQHWNSVTATNTVVDLSLGTIVSSNDDYSKITDYGNGWYRVECRRITGADADVTHIFIGAMDGTNINYFGTTGLAAIYIWGAQNESGKYASSYIPTTGSTVTRIADTITPLTGVSSLIGQTEGTLYFEGDTFADSSEKQITLSDGTTGNRVILSFQSGNIIRAAITTGGVNQALIDNSGFISGTNYKVAIIYGNNYTALFVNGVKIGEDLSVSIPTNMTNIEFANGSGTNISVFYGNKKVLALSKIAISDAEALTLTTP